VSVDSVRTPQPLNIASDSSRRATGSAFSSSTIPVHRQWPMFEPTPSIRRLSRSSPSAKYPPPGASTQKSWLKRRFSASARLRSDCASVWSPASVAQ
jgi:hypothetical protein